MSEKQKIKIATPDGVATLSIGLSDYLATVEPEGEAAQEAGERGYRACVKECHRVLDDLQIPPAKGEPCNDPQCASPLGHRLRELRNRYLMQLALIQTIRDDPSRAGEILEEKQHVH